MLIVWFPYLSFSLVPSSLSFACVIFSSLLFQVFTPHLFLIESSFLSPSSRFFSLFLFFSLSPAVRSLPSFFSFSFYFSRFLVSPLLYPPSISSDFPFFLSLFSLSFFFDSFSHFIILCLVSHFPLIILFTIFLFYLFIKFLFCYITFPSCFFFFTHSLYFFFVLYTGSLTFSKYITNP